MMRILIIIFIGLLFTSCKEANKSVDSKKLIHSKLESKIDSLFNTYYVENGPAAAILISYEGKNIVKKAYGLSNLSQKEKATSETNFRSASLAKQFTALGILGLVQESKIQLSDTVSKYIPYPIFKNVTIEQLTSHTSGIEDAEYMIKKNWKSNDFVQLDDVLDWYKNNNVTRFDPGTKFEYNNGAYSVLVKIIEIVTGSSFSDYMQKIVFDKIGMNNTQYVNSKTIGKIPNMAICYEKDSLGNWKSDEQHFLNVLVGSGGIYTNLEDYSRYLDALRKNRILDKSISQLIFKPVSMNIELHSEDMSILKGKESSYAMGWEVTDSLAVSAGLYYGVNNWSIYEFDRPLSLIILTNSNILFKEKLVDKTYNIINEYFKTTANNVYKK
jgi:CubicO group peptidase (beta-lactamase class C family)